MNYVVWDLETDSADTNWLQILEVGCIFLDKNFKEIERFSARCRIRPDRVPSATALCINRTNVDLLTKANLSSYQFLTIIEKKFREYTPATFLAYSGINFDSEAIRKEFFKSLKKPYIENTEGNFRHDALNIVRAAFAVDDKVIKSKLNAKNNISMRLADLSESNGFNIDDSHNAMVDTELTVKVLDLIKNKQPTLWVDYFKTSSKQAVEDIMRKEKLITLNEYFYGRSRVYLCAPLHPNCFIHEIYKWSQVFDIRIDPEPLFKLSYSELKKEVSKTPKFIRTVRSNKAPIILDKSYGSKVEPYSSMDINEIKKRAELIKSNEKFSRDVINILKENAEEKMQVSSQEDLPAEESIYVRFSPNKDQALFPKWHAANWPEKFAMLDKFEDDRLVSFGHQLIFNESPDVLPESIYKSIKQKVASRILSKNNERWWTVGAFYSELDEIRENDEKMFSFKSKDEKLNFLEGINDYVMQLEKKYESA